MEKPKTLKEKFAAFKYSLYAAKLITKAAPRFLPMMIISALAYNIFQSFIQGVLFLKTMLDIVTKGGSFKDFAAVLILFVIGGIIANAFDNFGDYISMVQSKVAYKKLNEMVFKKASEVDMSCFDDPRFYDDYKRATEVISDDHCSSFVYMVSWLISQVVTGVIMISYVSSVDPKALIVLIAAIFAFALKTKVNELIFKKENSMVANRREKAYVQRVVFLRDYAKDVRTSGIFGIMQQRFKAATESNREIIKKYGKKIAAIQAASSLMGEAIPIAGTYSYAAYGYTKGILEVSNFAVLMTAVGKIKRVINSVSEIFADIQKVSLYFGNFKRFMEYEPAMVSGDKQPDELCSIEFRNVSFTYPGAETPTLKNVSLRIDRGETIAVVGKNGAGKSTFVKLLLRFYDPDEGEILYNGVDVREYDIKSLREKIGTVFQDYKVFALSVNENVLCREVENDGDRQKAEKALKSSGASAKISTLENGADTVLTREFDPKGAGLSGGEQQKVAAARMFAHDFDLAVLDEPSSALDPIAEYKMYEALIEETKEKTVVYISHRLSSAVLSDRIYVFNDGTVAESGTHGELMSANGIYAEMFSMQASSYGDNNGLPSQASSYGDNNGLSSQASSYGDNNGLSSQASSYGGEKEVTDNG